VFVGVIGVTHIGKEFGMIEFIISLMKELGLSVNDNDHE
jgi:hypothetical protein